MSFRKPVNLTPLEGTATAAKLLTENLEILMSFKKRSEEFSLMSIIFTNSFM